MRILDVNNVEIPSPDLSCGYLREESVFVAHHPATEYQEEIWHYKTIKEYPNGGKDVEKVIDRPGVQAQEAWDEYETILRYIRYTAEDLEALKNDSDKPTLSDRVDTLETETADLNEALDMILSGVTE